MGIVRFDIGLNIFFEDIKYEIKGYASLDEVLLKQTEPPYIEKIVKISELAKETQNTTTAPKQLVDTNEREFQEALQKYLIIEPLLNMDGRTTKDVQKVANFHKKGIATIFRWLSTFETYGTVSALASSKNNCGAKGKSRLGESVDAVIESVVNEFYLNKQQYPLSTIYENVVEKCNNLNIKAPTLNTLRNRVQTLDPKLVAKNRKGVSVRDTRGTPGKFPEVKMPLDVIQIDHTKMDVMLVDEVTRRDIGRPSIAVAIDVFSRMVYGFYISLEAPGYFSTGQCLLNASLPKDDILRARDIKGQWPVYGLPRAVHMDNGKEFRNNGLASFCQEFRIKDIYRPVTRPEFGGFIERLIGTSMKEVHQLPGTTFSNIFLKGKYDSSENASMTIDELEQWYTDFIVNVYHKTIHSSLGMTPEEKFYQGMYGVGNNMIPFLPSVPADTLKLRMALLPSAERSVQKNGITIDYITYFSETLRKWIIPAQYKKFTKSSNIVTCRRDPRDISKIYVFDKDINDYIIVPYADIKKPAMNLAELRKSISEAKLKITGREIEQHDVFSAHNRLYGYAQQAISTTKSVRRSESSKKHMKKTLEFDTQILKNTNTSERPYLNTPNSDDDDDGFEYYPVG